VLAANLGVCPEGTGWESLIIAERIARALLKPFHGSPGQQKDQSGMDAEAAKGQYLDRKRLAGQAAALASCFVREQSIRETIHPEGRSPQCPYGAGNDAIRAGRIADWHDLSD
jgi:hypothetical protein